MSCGRVCKYGPCRYPRCTTLARLERGVGVTLFAAWCAIVALMVAPAAKAGPPKHAPAPSSQAHAQAGAKASADAAAKAASSSEVVANVNAAGGAATSGPLVASPSYSTRAYALGLPSPPGAPAVGGNECMTHKPVVAVLGGSKGGRTVLDRECMAARQCLAVADRYAELGRADLALAQLARPECGGVEVPAVVPAPTCEEHSRRVFEACQTK